MAERSEKQYGFFLRFANMTFIPCEKCQKVLDDLVKENYFEINAPYEGSTSVYLSSGMEGKYSFELLFLIPKRQRGQSIMNVLFVPCDDCQTTLVKLLDEADLILGNVAYIPYIEFWRHRKTPRKFSTTISLDTYEYCRDRLSHLNAKETSEKKRR